jgi:hypothetical protein
LTASFPLVYCVIVVLKYVVYQLPTPTTCGVSGNHIMPPWSRLGKMSRTLEVCTISCTDYVVPRTKRVVSKRVIEQCGTAFSLGSTSGSQLLGGGVFILPTPASTRKTDKQSCIILKALALLSTLLKVAVLYHHGR